MSFFEKPRKIQENRGTHATWVSMGLGDHSDYEYDKEYVARKLRIIILLDLGLVFSFFDFIRGKTKTLNLCGVWGTIFIMDIAKD